MTTATARNNGNIIVVDCEDFGQASPRRYKEISINEAIPIIPELKYSRYEVLNKPVRKVYFDFDGIPDTPENQNLPDRFIEKWVQFMNSYNSSTKNILENNAVYVKTTNHDSQVHNGFSSHVIMYKLSMSVQDLKKSVLMFTNTEEGKEFIDYVDTVVYSKLRLFKLPNFIGIPMTNMNNYHRLDPKDNNLEHYIIQEILHTYRINYNVKVPKTVRRATRLISKPQTTQLTKEISDALLTLKNIFVERQPMYYNSDEQTKTLNVLIAQDGISELTKNKLRKYLPIKPENKPAVASLINLVKSKYKITDERLKQMVENYDKAQQELINDANNDNDDETTNDN